MPTPNELAEQAERFDEAEWTTFLEAVYDVARRRRTTGNGSEDEPGEPERDTIAGWVARKHLSADPGVSEVHFLPEGAPRDEIRLVEVSELSSESEDAPLSVVDFGLDVADAAFSLIVLDVSRPQLERLRRDPTSLPEGWTWKDSRTWRRGR